MSVMSELDLIRQELEQSNALARVRATPTMRQILANTFRCEREGMTARQTLRILRHLYPGERFSCLNEHVYVHGEQCTFCVAYCESF